LVFLKKIECSGTGTFAYVYKLNSIGRLISLINEPNILNRLKNKSNFVPQIISYFQDYENMYIITTFYDGPSLNKIALNLLNEKQIQFISACLIIALKDSFSI